MLLSLGEDVSVWMTQGMILKSHMSHAVGDVGGGRWNVERPFAELTGARWFF